MLVKKFLRYVLIIGIGLLILIGMIGCMRIFFFNHVETVQQRTSYLSTHLLTGYPKTNEQLLEENGHFKQAEMKGLDVICPTLASCPGLIIKTKDYTILYKRNGFCAVTDLKGMTYTFDDQMTALDGCSKRTTRKIKREWNARLDQIGHRTNFQFNLMPWKDFGL